MLKKETKEKTLEELQLEQTRKLEVLEAKNQKKGEFHAFLILLIITVVLVGGVYIWYTRFYDPSRDSWLANIIEKTKENEYEIVKYNTDNKLKQYGDYIVEYKNNNLYKVMNLKGEELIDDKIEFDNIYLDSNDNLYLLTNEEDELNNIIKIYKLEDKEFKEYKEYGEEDHKFYPLIYNDYLFGVVEEYKTYDELIIKSIVHTLDNKDYVIDSGNIQSEKLSKTNIDISSNRYLIIKSIDNNKYGIYDLASDSQIIDYKYDYLSFVKEDIFIAKQNKKVGIITSKLKKVLDYNYDNVIYKNDLFIASLNNNISILNNNYEEVTNFDLDNKERSLIDPILSMNAYKFNDTYIVLSTSIYKIENNEKEVLDINNFVVNDDLIYSYNKDKKEYIIYDKDLKEVSKIDLSKYDIEYSKLYLMNPSTIALNNKNKIYFDYNTGEVIDNPNDYEYEFNNIKYKYSGKDNTIVISENNKELESFKYNVIR